MSCRELCHELFRDRLDYYLRWYHSKPLQITSARRDELRLVHKLLYRCVEHIAAEYKRYVPRFIPLPGKVMEILDYQSRIPFKAGAWRPDYLIGEDGSLMLVEITCRFFGHGIWFGYPAEFMADRFMQNHGLENSGSRFEELLQYMRSYIPEGKRIAVLKSSDKTNEIALYKAFYEHFGHEVLVLEADEVEPRSSEWRNGAFVISALNQEDILSFSSDTLRALVDCGMVNDFRTIFLAHDKRFLRLIFEDDFTRDIMTPEEADFLRAHTIRTWLPGELPEIKDDMLAHKDHYIIKPYDLGKSVGIHAGCMTPAPEWESLLASPVMGKMIIQPFLAQRTYPVLWEGQRFDDYICGMMLCVNDRYFDSGLVRTSSAPVTNVTDDRKKAVIHTDHVFPDNEIDLL